MLFLHECLHVVWCCAALRCAALRGEVDGIVLGRICEDAGKRFDGVKRLNSEKGRLCLPVIICFGWISPPLGCLQRDTALLDGERDDIETWKRQSWLGFFLNVEGRRVGVG